jgi:K+-sensing histidine kinase KdpD
LGLTICKEIIEGHNGIIKLKQNRPSGLIIHILL